MPKVTVIKPTTTTIHYEPEKTDSDYSKCLWADFIFDTENYRLSIHSDCGDYSYAWIPTPNSESFLHLMCRIEKEYLLEKISNRTDIDEKQTLSNLKRLFKSIENQIDFEEIEAIVNQSAFSADIADNIRSYLTSADINTTIEWFDVYDAVEKDYPQRAKTIVDIFFDYIIPFLKNLTAEKIYEKGLFYNIPEKKEIIEVYHNPDADAGGQFVINHYPYSLIEKAAKEETLENFFNVLDENADQKLIDKETTAYQQIINDGYPALIHQNIKPIGGGRTLESLAALIYYAFFDKT